MLEQWFVMSFRIGDLRKHGFRPPKRQCDLAFSTSVGLDMMSTPWRALRISLPRQSPHLQSSSDARPWLARILVAIRAVLFKRTSARGCLAYADFPGAKNCGQTGQIIKNSLRHSSLYSKVSCSSQAAPQYTSTPLHTNAEKQSREPKCRLTLVAKVPKTAIKSIF